MDAARHLHSPSRTGMTRLLEHCETLGRVTAEHQATARARLETELGCELARRLIGALAAGSRTRAFRPV